MSQDFVLLARGTPFYVVGDPFVHSLPLLELLGLPYCFIMSWMSRSQVIMS
jgi:hypothetical protein